MDSWITWPEVGGAVAVGGALWALRWAAADFVLDRFGDVWTDRLHGGHRVVDGVSPVQSQPGKSPNGYETRSAQSRFATDKQALARLTRANWPTGNTYPWPLL